MDKVYPVGALNLEQFKKLKNGHEFWKASKVLKAIRKIIFLGIFIEDCRFYDCEVIFDDLENYKTTSSILDDNLVLNTYNDWFIFTDENEAYHYVYGYPNMPDDGRLLDLEE